MDYCAFREALLELLREKTGGNTKVGLRQIKKNNGVFMEAVMLTGKGEKLAPAVYLKDLYELYEAGAGLEEIVLQILDLDREQKKEAEKLLGIFEDYTKVRGRIYYKLINYKMNQSMLQKMPYIRYLDLAVVFYYRIEGGPLHGAATLIQNCNLEVWGIDKRQIMEDAVLNTSRKLPYTLRGMEELIADLSGEKTEFPEGKELMYVLTNEEKYYGAAVLLYPYVLNHIAKILKKNFYVLPSSVHECILVPDQGEYSRFELMKMVKEVNEKQVDDEEVLSYEVYYYDRNKQELLM